MEEVPLRKSLKRRVTRREWKLRLRVAEGILNYENRPKCNLSPDRLSNHYIVNPSVNASNWQVNNQQVNNTGCKERCDNTQAHEEATSSLQLSLVDYEMDNIHDTDQADTTNDTDKADMIYDTDQADVTCDTDQADMMYDTDQVDIMSDTDQADTTDDTDQADVMYDTDQADTTNDTDQADVMYDTEQADTIHDTDEVDTSSDSILCNDASNEEQTVNPAFHELVNNSKIQCLYSGSNITNRDFSVALLSISHKHSLTNSCIVDTLNLFSQVLPTGLPNQLPKSHHVLMKTFVDYNKSIVVHRCCGYCSRLLSSNSSCEIPECRRAHVAESSFIQVLIDKQLQTLFSDEKFVKLLSYRFVRPSHPDVIEDIYDGTIYKELHSFFDNPFNISLNLNYDGAPKFKSNNMQVWPVQFSINELPPLARRSKNYMILAGLWCSSQKPPSFTFLEPIFTTLKEMNVAGTKILVAGKGNQTVRVQLICAIMDLPAKAMMLNCNQYNGQFGCSVCKHSGEMVAVGKGRTRSYPYKCNVKLRTHQDHFKDAEKALKSKSVINGVKGYSALHMLTYFDVVRSTPVDYMHCVLLGVVKKLATLWFDSSNHKKDWYIGKKLKQVDERLLQIFLPDVISRTPRSISERKFWKASEWKSFLFFYIPVMNGILPDQYYIHVFLLIKSIQILLSCGISKDDLQLAETLLNKFCSGMETLYGICNCSINVHSLLHLPYYVQLLGPLWTHSAFLFESNIHNLLNHSHASHGIGKQIAESFLLNQKLYLERSKLLDSPSCSLEMKLFLKSFQTTASSDYAHQTTEMVGSGDLYSLQDEELEEINLLLSSINSPCLSSSVVRTYAKVKIDGNMFFSKNYKRVTKRNSYTISYSKPPSNYVYYGLIENFLSANGHYLAAIRTLEIISTGPIHQFSEDIIAIDSKKILFSDYLTFEYGSRAYILVNQILKKCCNLSTSNWNVLTHLVNNVEFE